MTTDGGGRLSYELGEFVSGLRYEDLPEEVVRHAKACLLDTLGCGLYGSTLSWSRILRETLAQVDGGGGSCCLWGTGTRLTAPHAALANGASVHAFELDDLHRESILHPGSVVAPAALAAASLGQQLSGKRLLVALVAGYEVGARVGMTVGTAHLLAGWHPTGTHGTLAAAAAAASVLRLSASGVQQALGIAGSQSAGLMAAQYSSMVKRFHAGRAAQSGLYAALLARGGYTGITNLFESDYGGYCSTFSPTYDLDRLTDGLGRRFEALRVGFKAYSANGSCHPAIEILKKLRADGHFGPAEVERVVVHASSATVAHVGWDYEPGSVTTAQMNLPYIAAVVLSDGEAFVDQFAEERITDPTLVELSRRVVVEADPEIDARGPSYRHFTRVALHLSDGRVLRGEQRDARGSPTSPLSDGEVHAKYRRLSSKAISEHEVTRVEELVAHLDELVDIGELADALGVTSGMESC